MFAKGKQASATTCVFVDAHDHHPEHTKFHAYGSERILNEASAVRGHILPCC
jgi:hypothetical protein